MNEKFIPYAPTWGDGSGKYPWWAETRKDFMANHAEKLIASTINGQFWFILTAAGQPVPARKVKATGPRGDLAGTLRQILQLYAQLPESQRKPDSPITDADRPTPAPPPGGVVLTFYDRFLRHKDNGEYQTVVGPRSRQQPMTVTGPQRNSLWLTQEECRALVPDHPRPGQTLTVPALVAQRIFLFGFISGTAWHAGYNWKADSVRSGSLTVTVAEASASRVRMRIHGSVLLVAKTKSGYAVDRPNIPEWLNNEYDARLEGEIDYDPVRKQITRWDMVALGDYLGLCYAYDHPKPFAYKPHVLGFAFELDRGSYESPPELRRYKPSALYFVPERFYFDPEKWKADEKNRKKK